MEKFYRGSENIIAINNSIRNMHIKRILYKKTFIKNINLNIGYGIKQCLLFFLPILIKWVLLKISKDNGSDVCCITK